MNYDFLSCKKTALVLILVAAVAVVGIVVTFWADRDRGHHGRGEGCFSAFRNGDADEASECGSRMIDGLLDLSEAQEQQVAGLLREHIEEMRVTKDSYITDTKAKLSQDTLSAAEIKALMTQHTDQNHRAMMLDSSAELLASIHALLTPEQRAELAEQMVGMRFGMGKGMMGAMMFGMHQGGKPHGWRY